MEVVRFNKNGGVVAINIAIIGNIGWSYEYVADDYTFTNDSSNPRPMVHSLGLPHELQNDFHSWDFTIANFSNGKETYELEIEWKQDNKTIHTWSRKGSLTASEGNVVKDDAVLGGV